MDLSSRGIMRFVERKKLGGRGSARSTEFRWGSNWGCEFRCTILVLVAKCELLFLFGQKDLLNCGTRVSKIQSLNLRSIRKEIWETENDKLFLDRGLKNRLLGSFVNSLTYWIVGKVILFFSLWLSCFMRLRIIELEKFNPMAISRVCDIFVSFMFVCFDWSSRTWRNFKNQFLTNYR